LIPQLTNAAHLLPTELRSEIIQACITSFIDHANRVACHIDAAAAAAEPPPLLKLKMLSISFDSIVEVLTPPNEQPSSDLFISPSSSSGSSGVASSNSCYTMPREVCHDLFKLLWQDMFRIARATWNQSSSSVVNHDHDTNQEDDDDDDDETLKEEKEWATDRLNSIETGSCNLFKI
jgi:hypothetical protein